VLITVTCNMVWRNGRYCITG